MTRYLRPGTVALDVGASIGLWTVPMAKSARQVDAAVVAFEPLPANLRWLRANLALNGVSDVVSVHDIALGSRAHVMRLESAEMAGGSAALAVADAHPLAADGIDVMVRRLDDLELSHPVSFMKLDIEGFECQALNGALSLIARERPVIFGEFDPRFLALRGEPLTPLLEHLATLGYHVATVETVRKRPWSARDLPRLRRLALPLTSPSPGDLLLLPEWTRSAGAAVGAVSRG
jgi:FkbM family methyltransferase